MNESLGIDIRTFIPLDYQNDKLNTADISLTITSNILITALILFRLIRAQKKFTALLPHMDHKIYIGIVSILVESAAPVALFGIGSVATLPLTGYEGYQAGTIFSILYTCTIVCENLL